MPELPELAKMARGINRFAKGKKFVSIIKAEISKNPSITLPFTPFRISASSRGKELLLSIDPPKDGEDLPRSLRMTMGLNGYWRYNIKEETPKYTLLTFETEDGDKMVYGDKLRYGKWGFADGFSMNRSPDPVQDFEGFVENIADAFKRTRTVTAFKKNPIGEVLLNQKYFNGIGNYLRAEILYRANIHPMENTYNALLVSEPLSHDTEEKSIPLPSPDVFDFHNSIILKLCNSFPNEMLALSSTSDYSKFKVYSQKHVEKFQDKNRRTVWFHPRQKFAIVPHNVEEIKENLANLPKRAARKRKPLATKKPPKKKAKAE